MGLIFFIFLFSEKYRGNGITGGVWLFSTLKRNGIENGEGDENDSKNLMGSDPLVKKVCSGISTSRQFSSWPTREQRQNLMDISKNWGNIQCAVQKFAYSESMDGNNTKIWSPIYRHIQSSHSANWPVPPIQHDHAQPMGV
jgi:hypothetical protein